MGDTVLITGNTTMPSSIDASTFGLALLAVGAVIGLAAGLWAVLLYDKARRVENERQLEQITAIGSTIDQHRDYMRDMVIADAKLRAVMASVHERRERFKRIERLQAAVVPTPTSHLGRDTARL